MVISSKAGFVGPVMKTNQTVHQLVNHVIHVHSNFHNFYNIRKLNIRRHTCYNYFNLRGLLMVGKPALNRSIGVQVPAPQQVKLNRIGEKIGYFLLYIGYWIMSFVFLLLDYVSWILSIASCILNIEYYILYVIYWIMSTKYCLLDIEYCLLNTGFCIMTNEYCLLHLVFCLLTNGYCLLSSVYCILSTTYYINIASV